MSDLFTLHNLATLGTLSVLEIVLGVDNIVVLALLIGRLPKEMQKKARWLGLGLALVFRVLLLSLLNWMMYLTNPLFSLAGHAFSGRDLILFGGGLFLIWKAAAEIAHLLHLFGEKAEKEISPKNRLISALLQIVFIDLVFSLDSIITAIGISREIIIMITAIMFAIIFMMVAVNAVGKFIERHPSVKILALSFLLLVGAVLIAESFGHTVSHAYIYAAMGFASLVEILNIQYRRVKRNAGHHY